MHRRSLERFPFDSVLLPYNYAADARRALRGRVRGAGARRAPSAASRCRRSRASRSRRGTDGRRPPTTWYEPLTDPADIDVAVHWVLARPEVFLNTVGDVSLLPHVLAAAERIDRAPPTADEVEALVERRSHAPLFV